MQPSRGSDHVEDVAFSPGNCRLALAASDRNTIGICSIDITLIGNRPRVTISNAVEYSAPCLNEPHGVDFVDDGTVIVANRQGSVTVHRLSSDDDTYESGELLSFNASGPTRFAHLGAPSSLTVVEHPGHGIEVLVCSSSHRVTRHDLDNDSLSVTNSEVLLERHLDYPDGVAVSADNRWIALSSHHNHHVMLYDRSRPLDAKSDPDAILLGAHGPHGLRFSLDGRHLFVAVTENPYVHVYPREATGPGVACDIRWRRYESETTTCFSGPRWNLRSRTVDQKASIWIVAARSWLSLQRPRPWPSSMPRRSLKARHNGAPITRCKWRLRSKHWKTHPARRTNQGARTVHVVPHHETATRNQGRLAAKTASLRRLRHAKRRHRDRR